MTEERYVLDASALLAMLGREPGGDAVAMTMAVATISTVNWAELLQKAQAHGVDVAGLDDELRSLGLEFEPFGVAEADAAARIWLEGARHLAFADRACLATALVHGYTPVTADRAWADAGLGMEVRLIR